MNIKKQNTIYQMFLFCLMVICFIGIISCITLTLIKIDQVLTTLHTSEQFLDSLPKRSDISDDTLLQPLKKWPHYDPEQK